MSITDLPSPPDTPAERRQNPRYRTEQRVWIKFDPKEPWVRRKTKNLSRFGICVPLSGLPQQMRLKPKSQVELVILVYLDKEKNVTRIHRYVGYVIHVQANGDVGFLLQKRNPV